MATSGRRWSVRPSTIGGGLVLLVMALVILYPIGLLIYSSFVVPEEGGSRLGFDLWRTAFDQAGLATSVVNTFWRVAVTELFAFPAAVLLVWLVTRTDLPGKKWIDMFCWAAFFLPALPVLMGWILLFDPQFGLANQLVMCLF